MLNGDVLTDIDLTAQLRQHERTGARATLALIAVDDPSAYGLVRRDETRSVREFVEKPSADEIDTNLINAGAYILERDVLAGMAPSRTKISIERDVFPTLVGNGLFGYEAAGYWMDIGTPERYLQATFDILEGEVATEVGAGRRRGRRGPAPTAAMAPASSTRRRCWAPGANWPRRRDVGGRTVLGRGVKVGAGAHIDSSVLLDGATIGAGTRITGSIVGPGVTIGDHCRIEGRVVLGAGVERRLGQHAARPGSVSSPAWSFPMGRSRFEHHELASRRGDRGGRHQRPVRRRPRPARASARRAVAGGVGRPRARRTRPAAWSSPAWAARRSAACWPARRSATAPRGRSWWPRLRAAGLDDARHDRPVLQLLGRHRGDAGRLRGRRGARRAADRLHDRREAGPAGARRRRAGDPAPRRLSAPRRGRLHAGRGARGGGAGRLRRAAAHRDRRRRRPRRAARWRSGAPTRPRTRWPRSLARSLHGTVPQIIGAGLTAPIAYRWKTQINENAKTPAFAAELPELDHNEIVGWDGAARLGPLQRRVPRRLRPASARAGSGSS